jgi:hypothetical protein
MRHSLNTILLVLLTLTGALGRGTAQAQATGTPPSAAPPQSQNADTEQPAASRRQSADTEQPVRMRQRYGVGARSGGRHLGLLIGGIVTLGASYGLSASVGFQLMSKYPSGSWQETSGRRLLFPIVGPWVAVPAASTGAAKGVFAVLGVAQALGVILTIAGSARVNADVPAEEMRDRKPPPQWRSNGRLGFLMVPMRDGAGGVLSGSF